MAEPKTVLLVITASRSVPGCVSLREYPTGRPRMQEALTAAGYTAGDVVEVRLYHGTRIRSEELPPPGQLMKRRRRKVAP